MPTIFTHSAIGFASSAALTPGERVNKRIAVTAMILSALPDFDALFISVIPYDHPLGHRGFTHSLLFAALIGAGLAVLLSRIGWAEGVPIRSLAMLFILVTASHGFFDSMTNGGLGVAFFSPFDNTRYFLPWMPIPVAPLSASRMFTGRGLYLMWREFCLFWTFAIGLLCWKHGGWVFRIAAVLLAIGGTAAWALA